MAFMHFDRSMEILKSQKISRYKWQILPLINSYGYTLAEDIVATQNSPEFETSAMDGYAIRYEDMQMGKIPIVDINPAGADKEYQLNPKKAIKTFTGSIMPKGSDTLIPIENVEVENNHIVIKQSVPKGFSVREVGENYAKDELLIPKGTYIDYPQIGVLAGLNRAEVKVYTKPKVAVLATGSELLSVGEVQTKHSQIRSTNNYTIESIVKKYGGEPVSLGCVGDSIESITQAVTNALDVADIVVTTGGVSVGDFDFVKDVVAKIGGEVLFKGVRIKPGQHIMVAREKDKFIVALPGFAYSSTVTALLYVVPLIAMMQNRKNPIQKINARLKESFTKRAKKAEFTACNLYIEGGEYVVDFKNKKVGTSAILTNMLGSVGLLYTSEDESNKEVGEVVEVLMI